MDGLDLPVRGQELDYESSLHALWPSEAAECPPKARTLRGSGEHCRIQALV